MDNFNEIFLLILKEYQNTGNLDAAINVLNLSSEKKERIQQAFQTLDAIEANAKSLREAKEEGTSRKNWLAQQILTTCKDNNLSESQTEDIFGNLAKAYGKVSDNVVKED